MAFSLWNRCNYDSDKDKKEKYQYIIIQVKYFVVVMLHTL